MFRKFFWLRLVWTLLMVGVLVAGGVLLYHAGFNNGYNAAVLALNVSGKTGVFPLPYNSLMPYGPGFGFLSFFLMAPLGLFLGLGFLFLVFAIVGSIIRLFTWRHWASKRGWGGFGHHDPANFKDWQARHPGAAAWFKDWEAMHHSGDPEKSAPGETPNQTV